MARAHYENFTVISWLAPLRMRSHIARVYAFCRTVDDIGDEAEGNRGELLDRFENELRAARDGNSRHPVTIALGRTIAEFDLPQEPFLKLIEANRIDQRKSRYESFAEVLSYCEYSANPVGRIFLMLYGYRDERRFALSDATCTALQLTNFLQDVKRDYEKGRIYLSAEAMAEHGVEESDLAGRRAGISLKELMASEVARARAHFALGLPLMDAVRGHLRVDIGLFSRGGLAILDKIERSDHDTLASRPVLSGREKVGLLVSTLFSSNWRRWIGN